MSSSSIEAPEEVLRRLARERRAAREAALSTDGLAPEQLAQKRGRDVAVSWLLEEGTRLRAEHTTNLAAVLKTLITRYLQYVLTAVKVGQLAGLPVALPILPMAQGLLDTASAVKQAAASPRGGAIIARLFDHEVDNPLSPNNTSRQEFKVIQGNVVKFNPAHLANSSPPASAEPQVLPISQLTTMPAVQQKILEANRVFRVSRRQTVLAYARCLRSCLRKAISFLPEKEREATSAALERIAAAGHQANALVEAKPTPVLNKDA